MYDSREPRHPTPRYSITIAFPIGTILDWRVAIATWKVYIDVNPPRKSNILATYGKTCV